MKKLLSLLCILAMFTLMLAGCAPKGEPSEVLNKYYQNIKDHNIEGAYETLSKESKKIFTKEDFTKWMDIKKELSSLKEAKVEKTNEYKDKELDGVKFKNVVEFNVTEKFQNFYDDKEKSINYKRNVVNDEGKWKVYRGKENGKQLVAGALTELGWLYMEGKGSKSKDLNQAATIFNEAINYDKELPAIHYGLACVYSDLKRYDESIEEANLCIRKTKDNIEKSDGYNVLGVAYQNKEQYDKAKESFAESVKLNPNNQYAKTNLENLKKLDELN